MSGWTSKKTSLERLKTITSEEIGSKRNEFWGICSGGTLETWKLD